MQMFEVNGVEYKTNEKGNYFYKLVNGKWERIKKDEYEMAFDAYTDQVVTEVVDGSVEPDPEQVEVEQKEVEEEAKQVVLDAGMEKLGYHRIESEFGDIRYTNATHEVMAWNTIEEGIAWVEEHWDDENKPAVINENGCVNCSGCKVPECIHRDCMRRNPVVVGGLGACPRLKVENPEDWDAENEIKERKEKEAEADRQTEETFNKEKKEKKVKKPRKSKDIAFTFVDTKNDNKLITLTKKQVDFLMLLPNTCFWEDGVDSVLWCDCIADDIEWNPMSVGAMISTLREKGLVAVEVQKVNGKKAKCMEFTDLGKAVIKEVGLE